jgi:2-dehydropantoate 2-reductase
MKIAVMGAGAVGCYYGGLLARAGHAVTLIGRAPHVAAVQRDGLRLQTASWQAQIPLHASTQASAAHDAQWVLCCVKAPDTEQAAADLAPHLAPDALVLSLQNGIDNAERLQARLAQRVAPVVVYVAAEMAGPGHVQHHGRGELIIGPLADSAAIVATFAGAGVPVQISDNVVGALWAKLIVNCAYNALSAITRQPYGLLVRGVGVARVIRDIVQECLAVAQASGVTVPGDIWEAVASIARTMPSQLSSTAQDLARGRRSEIDHLNGEVVRRGEALGVATPVNRVLHSLVNALEQRAQAAGANDSTPRSAAE